MVVQRKHAPECVIFLFQGKERLSHVFKHGTTTHTQCISSQNNLKQEETLSHSLVFYFHSHS